MIFNTNDLSVLKQFCLLESDNKVTTWEMMKKIYPVGGVKEHLRVKRSIEKLKDYGLLILNVKTLTINENQVQEERNWKLYKDIVIKKINYPNRTKNSVCFEIDDKWLSIEI